MQRTQIYLERAQHRTLKKRARERGISMTEYIRRVLAEHLRGPKHPRFSSEDVEAFVALENSGTSDTSERHDEVLDQAFRDGTLR